MQQVEQPQNQNQNGSCEFPVDISDKLLIINKDIPASNSVHKFDASSDIYDIISHFLETKNTDDPFYIVDLGEVCRQYNKWTSHLPRVQPYYAIKSNPDPMILHVLAKLGSGFDCASKEEIIMGKNTCVSDELLLFANTVKNNHSLQFARSQDVDYLTWDSISELDKIKLFHPDAKCILRIKVDDSGSECKFSSKFGCSLDEVKDLLYYAKLSEINVVGVSFHQGSNCKVHGQFSKAISDARKVFDIASELGITMGILDIGGGFPATDDIISFSSIAQEINGALDEYFGDLPDVKFISEPGRMFCASSHTLVATIIGIKTKITDGVREFQYTIDEGVYGSFNCIIFDHAVPVILPFNERTEQTYKSTIFGCSCDSLDKITCDAQLPKLAIGDRVFVRNFGAYTRASSSSFNGFKTSLIHYIITN